LNRVQYKFPDEIVITAEVGRMSNTELQRLNLEANHNAHCIKAASLK